MIAQDYSHLYKSGSFMVVKNHSHYVSVIAKKLCKKQCIFSCTKCLTSPRRLRAKYTIRTNLRFVLWVFRPCRELLLPKGRCVRNRTPKCPLTYIILPPLSLRNIYEGRKHYRTKFIYSDEQAPQCTGQDYLYIQPHQTGESVCSL